MCRILARTIALEVVEGCWIMPTPILLALPSMPKEIIAVGGFKDQFVFEGPSNVSRDDEKFGEFGESRAGRRKPERSAPDIVSEYLVR